MRRPRLTWRSGFSTTTACSRSVDGAQTWREGEVANVAPSVFGFAVAVHPRDPQTAWFMPAVKDECRVPVDGALVVRARVTAARRSTCSATACRSATYDLVYRHALAVDATGDCLAFGSTTGGLWFTGNQGDAWHASASPPIAAVTFV